MSTVVGYIPQDAGFVLCPNCVDAYAQRHGMNVESSEDFSAMFEDSEGDSYDYCDHCTASIEHALTEDGRYYEASFILMKEFKEMGINLILSYSTYPPPRLRGAIQDNLTLDLLRKVCSTYGSTLDDLRWDHKPRTLDKLIERLWHDSAATL